jgi:4-phospho-D-threonate 3-dehydrogenase / 4-phospho-D-erythronate 3-dehydrogenase
VKPILGITMGDAAGIGPELILKAFRTERLHACCRPLIIGSVAVMEFYQRRLGIPVGFRRVASVGSAEYRPGVLDVLDLDLVDVASLRVGVAHAIPGKAAVVYTQEAGRLALGGEIDAIVSAPLNKEAMRAAGYQFEGQTQILGELAGPNASA